MMTHLQNAGDLDVGQHGREELQQQNTLMRRPKRARTQRHEDAVDVELTCAMPLNARAFRYIANTYLQSKRSRIRKSAMEAAATSASYLKNSSASFSSATR
jgi:hypothetical protein